MIDRGTENLRLLLLTSLQQIHSQLTSQLHYTSIKMKLGNYLAARLSIELFFLFYSLHFCMFSSKNHQQSTITTTVIPTNKASFKYTFTSNPIYKSNLPSKSIISNIEYDHKIRERERRMLKQLFHQLQQRMNISLCG